MNHDLRWLQQVGAIWSPAVQTSYTDFVGWNNTEPLRPDGLVKLDLDYLHPDSRLLILGFVLVSALYRLRPRQDMVEGRPYRLGTLRLSDSGGYTQIYTKLVFSMWRSIRALRAQERIGQVHMTLDAPLEAIKQGINPNFRSYDQCLSQTLIYLRTYAAHRRSNDPFLNVLHGTTEAESRHWYDNVKGIGECEGWAFAGVPRAPMSLVLNRLLQMLDEKKLDRCPWIHFLGVGTQVDAVLLTAVRDGLRQVLNRPTLNVSYDDATAARGTTKYNRLFHPKPLELHELQTAPFPDHPSYVGEDDGNRRVPIFGSPVAERLIMRDICVKTTGTSTWDQQGRAFLENHSTFAKSRHLGHAAHVSLFPPGDAIRYLPAQLIALRAVIIKVIKNQDRKLLLAWKYQLDHPNLMLDIAKVWATNTSVAVT